MPLVRIEIYEGRSPEEVQQLADTVHEALVKKFARLPPIAFRSSSSTPANR